MEFLIGLIVGGVIAGGVSIYVVTHAITVAVNEVNKHVTTCFGIHYEGMRSMFLELHQSQDEDETTR